MGSGAPNGLVDQFEAWSLPTAGQSYGTGYPLKLLNKWLDSIVLRQIGGKNES